MHVLLLALNYYPDQLGNAPQMIGMCEGLVRRGHRVTVVCAFPHHADGQVEPEYRGKLWQRDHRNGVDILRTFIYTPQGGPSGRGHGKMSTGAKMANYASYTVTSLLAAASIPKVDVVFTPSPPLTLGLVDHALGALKRLPWVYNLQDLFPEAAVRLGVLTNPKVIRAFEHMENFVYRKASRLSVISEGFRQYLLAKGVPDAKIRVIPNSTDTKLITPSPHEGNSYRAAHGLQGKFVLQFSGRMGYSQGLEHVLEAWRTLDDLPDLRLMMVGDGQVQPMVAEALAGDPRAVVLPLQPRAQLGELLCAADVGLAPLRHGMASTSVPSKIFGIMGAGRATLACVEEGTDTAHMLDLADCGVYTPPEDPQALAQAVRSLYADRERSARMGANARQHVVAHYSQEAVVGQYEEMLLELVGSKRK